MNRLQGFRLSEPASRHRIEPMPLSGFVACPVGSSAGWQWQQIYRLAYEQARAVVQPSRLERLLARSFN